MNKFSDFGIKHKETHIFDVEKVSINDILNCEIEVLDYQGNVNTPNGPDRYVVKIKFNKKECKFFTNCGRIKEALSQIPKDKFPFSTIIKQKSLGGNARVYYFT